MQERELSEEVTHGSLLKNSARLWEGNSPTKRKMQFRHVKFIMSRQKPIVHVVVLSLSPTWPVDEVTVVKSGYFQPLQEEHSGSDGWLQNIRLCLCGKLSVLWVQTETLSCSTQHIIVETVAEKPNKDHVDPHPLDLSAVCDLQLDLHWLAELWLNLSWSWGCKPKTGNWIT